MKFNYFLFICFVSLVFSQEFHSLNIQSDDDCAPEGGSKEKKEFAVLVNFIPDENYRKDSCSVDIGNLWPKERQNGLGLFLPRAMDCSTMVTVECLPGTVLPNRVTPMPTQYTCHSTISTTEMPCSSARLTFKRNLSNQTSKYRSYIQVIALATKPCTDENHFFQCRSSYPDSCIDRKLHCNGRSECPKGDDEWLCHDPPSAGIPLVVIILIVFAVLLLICVLSTVLVCCCCRSAFNSIIRRFRRSKKDSSIEKGESAIVHGEDAGLMKALTSPSTIDTLPQQHLDGNSVLIDSTKPMYPRLN